MHRYRSHTCGALRDSDIGRDVRLSGWCHRIRDHGGLLFIDLRDHYGLTQVVADPDSPAFKVAETLHAEWVVRIDGKVRRRPDGTDNAELPTGRVEVYITEIEVLGPAGELPQAPQQFKQLIMVSGFDRYFQIAPCFRDEDARADRSPGEFYQLDLEMSFVTQQDVFDAVEPVMRGVFEEFAGGKAVTPKFPMIPYSQALLKYGTDKPDLRNPLVIADVTDEFNEPTVTFNAFKNIIKAGGVVRAIPAPGAASQPRSWFDKLNDWARTDMGAAGLGYIVWEGEDGKGPIAKLVPADVQQRLRAKTGVGPGDCVFFAA